MKNPISTESQDSVGEMSKSLKRGETGPEEIESLPSRGWLLYLPAALAIPGSIWPLEVIQLLLGCITLMLLLPAASVMLAVKGYRSLLFPVAVSLVILVTVSLFDWPLRAVCAIYRPSFDRVAAKVRSGDSPEFPRRLAPFLIRKGALDRGVVVAWTDTHPSGGTGFAQTPPGARQFNLFSSVSLDDKWQFIAED